MRLAAALVPVSLLVPALAPLAQGAGAPGAAAPAARSGVLLGVASLGTLWIAPDASGRIWILVREGEIVVPRADGFWSVRTEAAVVAADESLAGDARSDAAAEDSAASAAPEEAEPAPEDSLVEAERCDDGSCEPGGDWFARALVASPLGTPAREAIYGADAERVAALRETDGTSEIEVVFASPAWIAFSEYFETDELSPIRRHGAGIMHLDSLAARPYVYPDLPGPGPLAFDEAARSRHARECARQYVRADARAVGDDELFAWPARTLYLGRSAGRWRLFERFAVATGIMRGFVFDCELSDSLPVSLVGHDRLAPSWAELRRQLPAAIDAVASPSGDLVVVVADDWLRVYAPRGGRLGAPAASLALPFPRLVMAQWATGAEVARWTRALAPHFEPVGR